MPIPSITREAAEDLIAAIEEIMGEGVPYPGAKGDTFQKGAAMVFAEREVIPAMTVRSRLKRAKEIYGLEPRQSAFRPAKAQPLFEVEGLPWDGEPDAEELIAKLALQHRTRSEHHHAAKLRQVRVNMDGPVALAGFGDPHIDDPGCAWGDLERDVRICRDTPGIMAVNVGDSTNNWVGRLMRLYADQEVTSKQALKLIEWLMTALPWLVDQTGNHDSWNTEKGDPAAILHRLLKLPGIREDGSNRLRLSLPSGAEVFMHVRHDFPGGSPFNPAHALVRETLFGFRDHILMCGHRHSTGYIPVFHNDPRRLCHGFRLGTYKDFDHYAAEKGFQDTNWARSMGAVINPDHADDPTRFIKPFFNLEEMAEYLTWRRGKWEVGKSAA
jgi:hypothetical protein